MLQASNARLIRRTLAAAGAGILAWSGLILVAGAGQGGPAPAAPGQETGACLVCHGEGAPLPAAGIVHSAHAALFGAGGQACAACHGPSQAHLGLAEDGSRPPPDRSLGPDDLAADINSTCMNCHAGEVAPHWSGSAHEFEELACTDCHSAHDPLGDPALDPDRQVGLCFDCHQRERAEFMRPHRHPLATGGFSSDPGLLACSNCHDAHGSAAVADLDGMTLNETCYGCHAELRGPFLWEHAPVREDCSSCHLPHGAIHDAMLRQRPPQLCQQCHLARFHPSTVRSGTGLPPLGADPNLLGQNCMNCHTAVHGSNHPSSPGFTR
ncbi:MAG: DmsE family decaheme c-type cytochrome [Gammaproteobacteria bacterium]|jgi:DmsE family decaheme c-type cytochrome|nr:DmsE family decaheme c-type cytochrome [Gammaproteobacteria bacterium]